MLDFLRDLQMLALLESDSIHKQAHPVDLSAMLAAVVAENQDLAQLREHTPKFVHLTPSRWAASAFCCCA